MTRLSPQRSIEVIRLPGLTSYSDALTLQMERQKHVEAGVALNALFLLQHPPVITLGRNAHAENLVAAPNRLDALGVQVVESTRGGDVTYHGPGQLVAYPVLDLTHWRKAIRWYLRCLEEVVIRTLRRYGLKGERMEGFTGVWVEGAKVAAIGVGIHNWVTCHGVALNVDPDMSHFGLIVPCGIPDKPVASLRTLLGTPPPFEKVQDDFKAVFTEFFENWTPETDLP
jgi:lipoate-protein ligase B